jgi:hypothetical protein
VQHVAAGPIGLDVPAEWHVRPGLLNPGGNVTFSYASPLDLPSECEQTSGGGVCHPWPIVTLGPGGMVVAVRLGGMPGSQPPTGGQPITVAGLPARRIVGSADAGCRAIGGAQSIAVVVPAVPGTTGWLALDACLAGPDSEAGDAALGAITASVTIAGDGATPSPAGSPSPTSDAVASPAVVCATAQLQPPPSLSCRRAIAAALAVLPSGHALIVREEFRWGGLCPPGSACVPVLGDAGIVIFDFASGPSVFVYVRTEAGRIVAAGSPAPYPSGY